MDKNSINFKEFDLFIQRCLDKYFYVEPWKKLYERAGKLHKDIISDKPTIPDLIIYNKKFNKSLCFYSNNPKSYVKFPRIRFILRPKFRKEYNPIDTYGKGDETLPYKKDNNLTYKKDLKELESIHQKGIEKDLENENIFPKQNIIQNIEKQDMKEIKNKNSSDKKEFSINQRDEEEEEEEEPEWANDNVEDYKNEEIIFKAIPESIEMKAKDDIAFSSNSVNKKEKYQKCEEDAININVDNFFADESNNNLKEMQNKNKEKYNMLMEKGTSLNSSKNKNNESIIEDIMKSTKIEINDFDINNNFENNTFKNKNSSNEYFDIFDTKNNFKNIYIEDENPDENIFQPEEENNNNKDSKKYIKNKIQNDYLNEDLKNLSINNDQGNSKNNDLQRNQKLFQNKNYNNVSNLNNQLNANNQNINIQQMNFNNNQNFLSNNMRGLDGKYIYNIYNNNNFNLINLNNLSFPPFNNFNISENNYFPNTREFNNANLQRNNIPYNNIPNNNINKNELYVNNLNNMIYRYNVQNAIKYNLYNNVNSNPNNIYYNPINNNINNNNFSRNNAFLNSQNINNNIFVYNNINKNINNNIINNKFDINNNEKNNLINNNENKKLTKNLKNNQEKSEQNLNPIDYSDNPRQILMKNMNMKRWIVSEKDKSNFILNFNNLELYEYLKEREGQESFNNVTINDSDTDYFFPTKEIYENLKQLYSHNIV